MQSMLALVIVLLAAGYLGWRLTRRIRGIGQTGCGSGCGGCSSGKRPLVTLAADRGSHRAAKHV